MGRTKGTPNKLTAEVKGRLQSIVDQTIDSLDISEMNTNQKIKLLQLGLQYIVPKLQMTTIAEEYEDQPLFIDVNVLERKKSLTEETESDVWIDNFEVKNKYKIPNNFKA